MFVVLGDRRRPGPPPSTRSAGLEALDMFVVLGDRRRPGSARDSFARPRGRAAGVERAGPRRPPAAGLDLSALRPRREPVAPARRPRAVAELCVSPGLPA